MRPKCYLGTARTSALVSYKLLSKGLYSRIPNCCSVPQSKKGTVLDSKCHRPKTRVTDAFPAALWRKPHEFMPARDLLQWRQDEGKHCPQVQRQEQGDCTELPNQLQE